MVLSFDQAVCASSPLDVNNGTNDEMGCNNQFALQKS
jgi:hypothetical protein